MTENEQTNNEEVEKQEGEQQDSAEKEERRFSLFKRRPKKKSEGQILKEALGMSQADIKDVEDKLFIARFLDYFCEETLDFIFKDRALEQYLTQIRTKIDSLEAGGEEDKLLKMSFEDKQIIETINKIKTNSESFSLGKGIKGSVDKKMRRTSLLITIPMFAVVIILAFIPGMELLYLFPILCVFCMAPQLIRNFTMKKWQRFKEASRDELYTENRNDIMTLKSFVNETLGNIRAKLLELEVPLQLIKFVLYSSDYENLSLINQKPLRGGMTQYYFHLNYPAGMEPFPVPSNLQQDVVEVPVPVIPRKEEKPENNFVVLTEIKAKDGIITDFIPTLKDQFADEINVILNECEFESSPIDFHNIIPNYSEDNAIYCLCGEIAEIINVQICNWNNRIKFYLFESMRCDCAEKIYALSLMDEDDEIPEELRNIFSS